MEEIIGKKLFKRAIYGAMAVAQWCS